MLKKFKITTDMPVGGIHYEDYFQFGVAVDLHQTGWRLTGRRAPVSGTNPSSH
jgi:hypothetical protein